jgi:hypothetical protein
MEVAYKKTPTATKAEITAITFLHKGNGFGLKFTLRGGGSGRGLKSSEISSVSAVLPLQQYIISETETFYIVNLENSFTNDKKFPSGLCFNLALWSSKIAKTRSLYLFLNSSSSIHCLAFQTIFSFLFENKTRYFI